MAEPAERITSPARLPGEGADRALRPQGFDEFVGNSRVDHAFEPSKAAATCFTCHVQRRENGYVFTTFMDRDRAAP